MLTDAQLHAVMPLLRAEKRAEYLPYLNAACREFDITTRARMAAFLGQVAEESGQLHYWEEIWGPTAAQRSYDGRMGNIHPGDGRKYRGRGPIELTGADNYRAAGTALGLDLIGNPDQVATPQVGFRTTCWFWKSHGLNELADRGEYEKITRRINGGLTGWNVRVDYRNAALKALPEGWVMGDEVKVKVDGKEVECSARSEPDGVVALLRPVLEAAGCTVAYDAATNTVVVTSGKGANG